MKLKVGVVGAGRLGSIYVRDLAARIPETTVAAVADTDLARASAIAAQFGIANAYASADELIADSDVEAVVIVTPTDTHRSVVVSAAAAKKPTFCEKPPAIDLASCRAMAEAIARRILAEKLAVSEPELEKKGVSVVSAGSFAMPGARATPQAARARRLRSRLRASRR